MAEVLGQVLLDWWGHGFSLVGKKPSYYSAKYENAKSSEVAGAESESNLFLGGFLQGKLIA